MDAHYVTPFIQSIQNVFSTMLQLQVTVQEPKVKSETKAAYDVTGIIGLSGDVAGTVVLSFPTGTAERVVSLFTGMELTSDSDHYADAVGELVNMICGGAKCMFTDRRVSISCPSVVLGTDHKIASPKDIPCIVIPCDTDCGEFAIEIMIDDRKSEQQTQAAQPASV